MTANTDTDTLDLASDAALPPEGAEVQADQPAVTGALPLYTDARPLRPETHGALAIAMEGEGDFTFAAGTPLVPVTIDEFERAALDYPLVFFGPARRAFAVTGVAADRSLFVDADGRYRAGAYVPAYLRRYPFVFARDEGDTLRILCLDQASPRVVAAGTQGATALFDGDQPSALTRHALGFCQAFEDAEQRTGRLIALLDELGLLGPQQVHLHHAGGEAEMLLDYLTIDRAKLAALSADDAKRLADSGATGAVWAMILSAANWEALAARREG